MIVIVDYGVGNLASVSNMLRKAGAQVCISRDPDQIKAADKLLLPGVGHFDHGMKMLQASGLRTTLDEFALGLRRPVLGICLGAQILGKGSEEGQEPGLGWLDMYCHRFPSLPQLRVPHMGWNQLQHKKSSPLFHPGSAEARFYFVHSFWMKCADPLDEIAAATHGIEFTCAVQRNNIYGVQFHPEKSLRHGLALMRSFVGLPST